MIFQGKKKMAEANKDGVYLGIDMIGKEPVLLEDNELNQQTFLVGTTGSGKTTTIMCFVEHALKRNMPLVLIDGKGDLDFANEIKTFSRRFMRECKVFSIGDPDSSCHYNPLVCGGPTELKDRLMSLSEWTEPYYQYMAERYLQMAFTLHEKAGSKMDLPTLVYNLSPKTLQQLAQNVGAPEYVLDYLKCINVDGIAGLIDRLAVMVESQIGHLFKEVPGRTIEIHETIRRGGVAIFSIDSLAYPVYAQYLGRLVINDLKATASRRRKGDGLAMTIYDEFNVFASRNVVDFINKTRSKGFCSLISTQSLADLDVVDNALKKQIIQNCNTVIIQRQNDPEDAEALASLVGTEETYTTTRQEDTLGSTGRGTEKRTKEFILHPDEIKRLQVGEAVVVRKIPTFRTNQLKIRQVVA